MSDDWLEIVYLALILIGMLTVFSWVAAAATWLLDALARLWAGKGEEREALSRIADAIERWEADGAARR